MATGLSESQKEEIRAVAARALKLLPADPGDGEAAGRIERAARAATTALDPTYTVLVSGLRSVGKSTFVSALWGDSQLLPTAVRDCTQTNTLIRIPAPDEEDRSLKLAYLERDDAVEFATRGLAYYRLAQMLSEVLGPLGPRLDELPPEERLRAAARAVRTLFDERKDVYVLHEHLSEQLDQLEEFLAFLDSDSYRPGGVVDARWEDRREHLMGRRRSDGRTLDVGKLLALRHVEVVRASDAWTGGTPRLIDTPWIPTFHNARRSDLILEQARTADILVIISLPEPYAPEEWVHRILRESPRLVGRTVLVFNQLDTVDTSQLFSRGGFAEAFADSSEAVGKLGFKGENILVACSRLPFLERDERDPAVKERSEKLRGILERIRRMSADSRSGTFRDALHAACDPGDAGIETLRTRLDAVWRVEVMKDRGRAALDAVAAVGEMDVEPGNAGAWGELAGRARRASLSLW